MQVLWFQACAAHATLPMARQLPEPAAPVAGASSFMVESAAWMAATARCERASGECAESAARARAKARRRVRPVFLARSRPYAFSVLDSGYSGAQHGSRPVAKPFGWARFAVFGVLVSLAAGRGCLEPLSIRFGSWLFSALFAAQG